MYDILVTFGLGVFATLMVIMLLLVASSRTSLRAVFLPRRAMDAATKVAKESAIVDAQSDGSGGFVVKLRGSAGLSEMRVVRRGEVTVSIAQRRDAAISAHGSFVFGKRETSPSSDSRTTNDAFDRARMVIEEALASRGFRLAGNASEAALVVHYHPAYDGPVDAADLDRHHGFHSDHEPKRDSTFASPVTPVYRRGSLVVDVSLADSNLLLWRCAALADVSSEDSTERKLARLRAAAEAMFDGFPPNVVAAAS